MLESQPNLRSQRRLENSSNPILKARYAHILWNSPKKHEKYAKIAINSYLELLIFYEEKDKKDPKELHLSDPDNFKKNMQAMLDNSIAWVVIDAERRKDLPRRLGTDAKRLHKRNLF